MSHSAGSPWNQARIDATEWDTENVIFDHSNLTVDENSKHNNT